jgi:hypothetical protein
MYYIMKGVQIIAVITGIRNEHLSVTANVMKFCSVVSSWLYEPSL